MSFGETMYALSLVSGVYKSLLARRRKKAEQACARAHSMPVKHEVESTNHCIPARGVLSRLRGPFCALREKAVRDVVVILSCPTES